MSLKAITWSLLGLAGARSDLGDGMSDRMQSALTELKKLRRELEELRARRSGSYRLRMSDVADIGKAYQEIESGEQAYGLRRLEAVLEDLEPRWRTL